MNYPRMLYKGGDVNAPYVIVVDEDAEKKARNDGFAAAYEQADRPKRGRKETK